MATFTDPNGNVQIRTPTIQLRVGRGVFRASELQDARSALVDRAEAAFQTSIRGKLLHLIFQNFRAGESWGPASVSLEATFAGPNRLGTGE